MAAKDTPGRKTERLVLEPGRERLELVPDPDAEELPQFEQEALSAKGELAELSRAYLEADREEKAAKAQKEVLRGPIMELISEVVREEVPLATKTVAIPRGEMHSAFEGDVRKWAALRYPEWTVESVTVNEAAYEVSLQESDQLARYEFEVDGFKFGRTVSKAAPEVDADALREDPDFVELGAAAEDLIVETTTYDLDGKKASRFLLANPESGPVFSRHTRPGQVSARLLPFTAITREDA
jgi:hypothetical protein